MFENKALQLMLYVQGILFREHLPQLHLHHELDTVQELARGYSLLL